MAYAYRFNRLAKRYGYRGSRRFPDTVTFRRPTNTIDSVGGVTASFANTSPTAVPCFYKPATGAQKRVASKLESDNSYMIHLPAQFSSALVDVDAKCQAVIAARSGNPGEPQRAMNIDWIGREEGIEIRILATIEE